MRLRIKQGSIFIKIKSDLGRTMKLFQNGLKSLLSEITFLAFRKRGKVVGQIVFCVARGPENVVVPLLIGRHI